MAEQTKGKMIPKQRLEIVNIEIDVPYSQGTKQLDRVQAVNLSLPEGDPLAGKPLRMTIFNQDVKTFVRGKKTVVADIEERPRDNPEYGPDRTIVQAYDDQGNPVSRKQGGGGGGFPRRSLEDDLALEAFKRVSIEGQTAIAQVGAIIASGKPPALVEEDWTRIQGKYWKSVEKGLDGFLADRPAPKPAQDKPPAARQTHQDAQGTAPKPDKVSSDQGRPEARVFKNFGEVLTLATKLKPSVGRAELMVALGLKEGQAPPDLNAAWLKAKELSLAKHSPEPVKEPEKLFE